MESEEELQNSNAPTANPQLIPQARSPPAAQQTSTTGDQVLDQLLALPFSDSTRTRAFTLITQVLDAATPLNRFGQDSLFEYLMGVLRSSVELEVKLFAVNSMNTMLYRPNNDELPPHWIETILQLLSNEQNSQVIDQLLDHLRLLASATHSNRKLILSLGGLSVLGQVASRGNDMNLLWQPSIVVEELCNDISELSTQELELVTSIIAEGLMRPNCATYHLQCCCRIYGKLCANMPDLERVFTPSLLARLVELLGSSQPDILIAVYDLIFNLIQQSETCSVGLFKLGLLEQAEHTILNIWSEPAIWTCINILRLYLKTAGAQEKLNNPPLIERLKEILYIEGIGEQCTCSIVVLFIDIIGVRTLRHFAMDPLLFQWTAERLRHQNTQEVNLALHFLWRTTIEFQRQGKADKVIFEMAIHGCLKQLTILTKHKSWEIRCAAETILMALHKSKV